MKILIADDHDLFLTGLQLILKNWNPDVELVCAHNYNDIFSVLKKTDDFDLIMTDLAMPGDIWQNAIARIHEQVPETPMVILSAVFDGEIVKKTIELGVSGYLSKTSSNREIIEAVDLVLSGGAYLPSDFLKTQMLGNNSMTDALLKGMKDEKTSETEKHLTPRQIDVLNCVANGKSNKQIAYELGLTEGTVKLHVTAILKILNVYNRTGAVMEAARLGLIKDNQ